METRQELYTFVFGGLVQQRRLAPQFFIYGEDLPGNGSKLKKEKEKGMEWNGTREELIQTRRDGGCLTGTHNVRSRFDALHGPNGLCR
jgi:hypothetical protein